MEHVTSFWLWSTLCVRQLRVFLDIIFSDAHRSPSPPPSRLQKLLSLCHRPTQRPSPTIAHAWLLYSTFSYSIRSRVCARTHTAFRLLFCFLLYIFPVKFWRSTKVSERERERLEINWRWQLSITFDVETTAVLVPAFQPDLVAQDGQETFKLFAAAL